MKIKCDECNKLMRTRGAKRVNNKIICYNCSLKYIPKIYMSLDNRYKDLNNSTTYK